MDSVVARSIFTWGSYRVLFQREVRAWMYALALPCAPPKTSTARAQTRRKARSLAISKKKLEPIAKPNRHRSCGLINLDFSRLHFSHEVDRGGEGESGFLNGRRA